MSFDVILFDLDGTLTDPALGITNSVAYALEKMGITPPQRQELLKCIGDKNSYGNDPCPPKDTK